MTSIFEYNSNILAAKQSCYYNERFDHPAYDESDYSQNIMKNHVQQENYSAYSTEEGTEMSSITMLNQENSP